MRTRSFHRISSMVLAIVLLLCLLPIPAHAWITSSDDITAYEGEYFSSGGYNSSDSINGITMEGTLPNGVSWGLDQEGDGGVFYGTPAIGSAGTYPIRFWDKDEEKTITIQVFAYETTPAATIDYVTEKLTGLVADEDYTINSATKTADGDGEIAIETAWLSTVLYIVKNGDGANTLDSASQSLTIPARPDAPSGLTAIQPSVIGGTGGISGTAAAMEYKLLTALTWTACIDGDVSGLAAGAYEVRIKATNSSFVSNTTQITITDFIATQEPTPTASIDYTSEKLTGLVAGAAYTIDGDLRAAGSDGSIAIEPAWLGTEISIVKKGNNTTTIDSDPQILPIPARPAAPSVTGVNETIDGKNDGKITDVDTYMEFSADIGASWTDCPETEIAGLAPGDYLVRVKAVVGTSFASTSSNVTIATGDAPTYTLTVSAPAFSNVTVGYSARPAARSITISNSGNSDATIQSVTVSGTAFTIDGSGSTVVSGGSINTWTVQPISRLSAGTYTETITVTYDGGATAKATVYFKVNAKATTGGSSSTYPTKKATEDIADTKTPLADEPDHTAYISGFSDGTFRPGSGLTRAEAAVLFYNLMERPVSMGSSFSDVLSGAWYYEAVSALSRAGVISGYPDGSFNPNGTITRAEFITMALRFMGIAEKSGATGDIENHWASGFIAAAVDAGYISGYPDGSFGPNNQVTRAEAVTILNRIIGCEGLSEGKSFSDVPKSYWAYEAITAAATGHNH